MHISRNLDADGMRHSIDDESILLTTGTAEAHDITYGYDNLNRLTDETADSSGSGYDVYYEYDLAGNRTLREITVNSQPLFTTEYDYCPDTDRLETETQCGASCAFDIGNERYYAYAKLNGKGFFYRDSNGNKIGSFQAFLIGLPSVWSRYLFLFVMSLVPVLLFGPSIKRLIIRLLLFRAVPSRLRLRVPRKGICLLVAFTMLLGPEGFNSIAMPNRSMPNSAFQAGERITERLNTLMMTTVRYLQRPRKLPQHRKLSRQ